MASLEEGEMMPVQPEVEGFAELDPATISRVQDSGWTEMLMQSLNDLRVKNTLCDVLLVGQGGQAVNAHATLLAAASPRFHELLQKTQSKIILNMPTVAGEVLQSVVDFVYQGGAGIGNVQLPELQKFAGAFSMDNLYKACDSSVSLGDVGSESGMAVDGDVTALGGGNGFTAVGGEGDGAPIKKEPGIPVPVGKTPNIYDDDDDEAEPFAEDSTATAAAASEAADTDDGRNCSREGVSNDGKEEDDLKIKCRQLKNVPGRARSHGLQHMRKFSHYCGRCKTYLEICPSADCNPHIPPKKKRVRRLLYSCDFCEQKFVRKERYEAHCHRHKGTYPFICQHCGKGMYGEETYKIHINRHNGEVLPHACDECDVRCTTKKGLMKHKECMHQRLAKFKCSHCEATFRHRSSLTVHIRTHTGAKPFKCTDCGRPFSDTTHLRVHMRIHTGEKPYSCATCGKFFTHLNSLKNHQKLHTGQGGRRGGGSRTVVVNTEEDVGVHQQEELMLLNGQTGQVLTSDTTFIVEEVQTLEDTEAMDLKALGSGVTYLVQADGSLISDLTGVHSNSTVTIATTQDDHPSITMVDDGQPNITMVEGNISQEFIE